MVHVDARTPHRILVRADALVVPAERLLLLRTRTEIRPDARRRGALRAGLDLLDVERAELQRVEASGDESRDLADEGLSLAVPP